MLDKSILDTKKKLRDFEEMQVKDFFSEIQNLLRKFAFIENVDVEYKVKSKMVGIIHGTLGMVDGSALQFMELIKKEVLLEIEGMISR